MVEENLHLSVLKKAFEEVKSSKDTITVNNYTIHRGLLLLFSPFISDLLASIPESNPAIITIPDTNLFDLVNVSELLLHGTCTNVKSTSDARDLFITLRTLGIDVQRLERRSMCTKTHGESQPEPLVFSRWCMVITKDWYCLQKLHRCRLS